MRPLGAAKLARISAGLRTASAGLTERTDILMAPQETLDLLLTLAGRKPLYLVRGFDPPGWRDRVVEIARKAAAGVLEGPQWSAEDFDAGAPDWLRAARISHPPERSLFVVPDRAVAREVAAVNAAGGVPTMAQEARLLGYPPCCVAESYARHRAFNAAIAEVFERHAGSPEAARRMVAEGDDNFEVSEEDRAKLQAAMASTTVPFTGVIFCAACDAVPDSPGRRLARAQEDFAWTVDPVLAGMIERAHDAGFGEDGP